VDVVIAVLMNIIAFSLVTAATDGWHSILLYIFIVACDAAFVFGKFKS
jgi:NADH:ubiquinone oxidoreductase subunit K